MTRPRHVLVALAAVSVLSAPGALTLGATSASPLTAVELVVPSAAAKPPTSKAAERRALRRCASRRTLARRRACRREVRRRFAARRRAARRRAARQQQTPASAPTTQGTPVGPAPSPGATEPLGRFLGVRAREFSLTLSRPALASGAVTIQLQNQGEDGHDLVVAPQGSAAAAVSFAELAPGGVDQQQADLPAGTYQLWCSLDGHRDAGMNASLRVE